jgi:hypothetical protein
MPRGLQSLSAAGKEPAVEPSLQLGTTHRIGLREFAERQEVEATEIDTLARQIMASAQAEPTRLLTAE